MASAKQQFVNMAVLLARLGEKTLLLDADFGMANSHILCGVNAEMTVEDFLEDKKSLEDIIYSTPYGLDLLPGGTGSSSILDISTNQRGNIIRASHDAVQNYDYLVIDVRGCFGSVTRFLCSERTPYRCFDG